ncbi:MAG TPA: YihY/virulence factor BrkB family protein [Candidatus Polarisedimenticolaceae bacterium]|nr:YihY/virulence factor BrkB family protein [Candidatus Polarisedimenticolaceae bacterium]
MSWLRTLRSLAADTYAEWSNDKVPRLGAALAYYTAFSLAPLLLIGISIAGLVLGREAAAGRVQDELALLLGAQGAHTVQDMIANAWQPRTGRWSLVAGVALLLFGASGVFAQLQDALDTIWEVQPNPHRGIWGTIRDRFFSFVMVLGTGFLLLVSLLLSAAVGALTDRLGAIGPAVSLIASLFLATGLFAAIFKVVPDAEVRWRDVWVGATATAVLFAVGKELLGLYLGRSDVSSSYGAAGSVLVLLLWVYYAAQILFLGAEFTQVWANRFGGRVQPARGAVPLGPEKRAQEGLPEPRAQKR